MFAYAGFHFSSPGKLSSCYNSMDSKALSPLMQLEKTKKKNQQQQQKDLKQGHLSSPGLGKGILWIIGSIAKLWSQKVPSLALGLIPLKLKFPKEHFEGLKKKVQNKNKAH